MIRRKHLALAGYLGTVAFAVILLFDAGEIFLSVFVPFASGVVMGVYLAIRIAIEDTARREVADLLLISAVLVLAPTAWYLLYGCVFGCLGG